jgi:predicted TIM-barrel fold metal-dependent hydrolase
MVGMAIDAWAQHPTLRFLQQDVFASLRRWTETGEPTRELPVACTLAAMDAGGVDLALISAWHGPAGALISNDEVAAFVAQAPDRLVGVASVDLHRPFVSCGAPSASSIGDIAQTTPSLGASLAGFALGEHRCQDR